MTVLLVGEELGELRSAFERLGIEVESATGRGLPPKPGGVQVAVVRCSDPIDAHQQQALTHAGQRAIPVALVFDRISSGSVATVLSCPADVWAVIEHRSLAQFPIEMVAERLRHQAAPGEGFAIGTTVAMPSDPEAYEAARGLSMLSPKMSGFVQALKGALSTMRRNTTPDMPWDPTNSGRTRSPATGHHEGVAKTGKAPPGVANLRDVIAGAGADWTATYAKPRGDDWARLPPALLIEGESGTGKSLVARIVHEQLWPTHQPHQLVPVSCTTIDARNFDYLMHGAAHGQWNNQRQSVGIFARAAFGTLFLDEIGDTPADAQLSLLTYFNSLLVEVQGGRSFFGFTQIVAATNADLDERVALGRFRHDLLQRFGNRVRIPALRDRGTEELTHLVDFVAQDPTNNPTIDVGGERRRAVTHISAEALARLVSHGYADGNFRELEMAVNGGVRAARRRGRRTVLVEDLRLRPARRLADRDERTVAVTRLPEAASDSVLVSSAAELRRLAALLATVVLRTPDGVLAVSGGGQWYTTNEERS